MPVRIIECDLQPGSLAMAKEVLETRFAAL